MTDTAELIAQATAAIEWCEAEDATLPTARTLHELRNALAAQAQEIERLLERIAELYRAEKNSFLSLKANGSTIAGLSERAEAAEARVREAEKERAIWKARAGAAERAVEIARIERIAIEAKTIERACAALLAIQRRGCFGNGSQALDDALAAIRTMVQR